MTARKLINSANQYMEFRDYFYLYEAIGYWDIIFFCIRHIGPKCLCLYVSQDPLVTLSLVGLLCLFLLFKVLIVTSIIYHLKFKQKH